MTRTFMILFVLLLSTSISFGQDPKYTKIEGCSKYDIITGSSSSEAPATPKPKPQLRIADYPDFIVDYLKETLSKEEFTALFGSGESEGNPLPVSSEDAILEDETNKPKKRMLIVTVNNFSEDGLFEEMTNLDGQKIAEKFKSFGYSGIDNAASPTVIKGIDATTVQFEKFVKTERATPKDTLLIYIVAHGVNEDSNFSVWFWKNKLTVPTMVEYIRTRIGKPPWGNVFLILDSCYSNKALDSMILPDKSRRLAIMTSAVDPLQTEENDDKTAPAKYYTGHAEFLGGNIKATAFSYYMTQVFDDDHLWDYVDGIYSDGQIQDGIITFDEMTWYLRDRLRCARVKGEIPNESGMIADIWSRDIKTKNQALAIKPEKIKNYKTPYWNEIKWSDTIARKTGAMRIIKGSISLVNKPDHFENIAAKSGAVDSLRESAETIKKNFTSKIIRKEALNSFLSLDEAQLIAFSKKAGIVKSSTVDFKNLLRDFSKNNIYRSQLAQIKKDEITPNASLSYNLYGNEMPTASVLKNSNPEARSSPDSNDSTNKIAGSTANTVSTPYAASNSSILLPSLQSNSSDSKINKQGIVANENRVYSSKLKIDSAASQSLSIPAGRRNLISSYLLKYSASFDDAIDLIKKNEYLEALQLLSNIESSRIYSIVSNPEFSDIDKQSEIEKFYLTLGIVQRYTGDLDEAVASYDRGLSLAPGSSVLMTEKASALILTSNKSKNSPSPGKEAVDLMLKALNLELGANNGVLPESVRKSVESFASQLFFLGRLGDFNDFNNRANELVK